MSSGMGLIGGVLNCALQTPVFASYSNGGAYPLSPADPVTVFGYNMAWTSV